MVTKIGINGFGRIARAVLRIAYYREDIEVVAINSVRDPELLAHLLKYDSLYGPFEEEITAESNHLIVGNNKIGIIGDRDPEKLDWSSYNVEVVVEATGKFRTRDEAAKHLGGSVENVIITAPGKNVDNTIVMGVNHDSFDPKNDFVISNASCTTNCLAPVVKVLDEEFGIENALMTTVHSYTMDQMILDGTHKDPRRARAANMSIIPTSTGAARAVAEVLPHLKGKIDGMSFRVPTPTVSTVDLVATLKKDISIEEVNSAFSNAKDKSLKGILDYNEIPLVSADYKGSTYSAVVDGKSTMKVGESMVKVIAWYDNEWAYSVRVVDLCSHIRNGNTGS
ncbi:type I glyceraldehyde-3-phosphate dehydrogenase [Natranaerobius trueperi]|uniref:Glyceraldehyde-3-phosphate dehydrogenase n=1 Tax=Natranaerobius trueperi TaxID=759412 RepID=A0A226BXY2_9FIRM|nr:type I glyceraldehyde-3-phosphate dehydrogenase [Natranaerobius trueperi]OWZ83795.1 type I glyceraldehyde-3-phosphate dehydrogenase [Natranaerobius trueperi]